MISAIDWLNMKKVTRMINIKSGFCFYMALTSWTNPLICNTVWVIEKLRLEISKSLFRKHNFLFFLQGSMNRVHRDKCRKGINENESFHNTMDGSKNQNHMEFWRRNNTVNQFISYFLSYEAFHFHLYFFLHLIGKPSNLIPFPLYWMR